MSGLSYEAHLSLSLIVSLSRVLLSLLVVSPCHRESCRDSSPDLSLDSERHFLADRCRRRRRSESFAEISEGRSRWIATSIARRATRETSSPASSPERSSTDKREITLRRTNERTNWHCRSRSSVASAGRERQRRETEWNSNTTNSVSTDEDTDRHNVRCLPRREVRGTEEKATLRANRGRRRLTL